MEKKNNDYALDKVPENMKRSWVAMFSVLVAIGVDLSSVILGAELAQGLPMDQAIFSVLLGSFFMAILYTICALVGTSTSLSTSMITKHVFGDTGAKIFSVVIGLSLLGWFGVQLGFFADNAKIVLSHLFNMEVNVQIISLIGGLLMMSTAIVGYKAMEKLSVYSVPFLLILMMVTLFLGIKSNGVPVVDNMESTMTFASGVSLSMSIGIVGAIISPNISRWSKSKKDCMLSSFFGMLFGNSFMIIVSIVLIKTMVSSDIMAIFVALGLAVPGIFILTLAQWTTNTSNLYSSSLGMSLIFKKVSSSKLTIVLGLIATGMAVLGIYNSFIGFLNILGIIIAPVGGIYTAEFYVVKEEFKNMDNEINNKNLVGKSMIAWIVGIIITFLATPAPDGLGLISITTIAPLDGFITGFIIQVILGKVLEASKLKKLQQVEKVQN